MTMHRFIYIYAVAVSIFALSCFIGPVGAVVIAPATSSEPTSAGTAANTVPSVSLTRQESPESVKDLWAEMRAHFQLIPVDHHQIELQARSIAANKTRIQISFEHASRYLFYILEEVNRRNMPAEVALIPFLESGFNPKSKHGLQPAGLWGLMPVAGKSLNLSANFFSDDRRDIQLSTQAALDLLQSLYVQFGDWRLALIAYNWGPGNVTSILRRQQALKFSTDFDQLHFPRSIQAYTAKLLAWRDLITYPERYGITLPNLAYQPYFAEVAATHNIDIDIAADLAEMSIEEFIYLNPAFNRTLIRGVAGHKILLPTSQVDVFLTNYLTHQENFSNWEDFLVAQTQRPEDIAKKYQINVAKLYEMNPLVRGAQISAGSSIFIPKSKR